MHYSGVTYRPPYEAYSVLLQVTEGCSHNACTFCSMYTGIPYAVSPLEEVEADIREAGALYPGAPRVFLLNGDAFSLPAERLITIGEMIHEHMPNVQEISGYASVNNIIGKSNEQLEQLAALGFCDLNIGLESGLDDVLVFMNKGYTLDVARDQLLRLCEAGISFSVNIINAAAGPARISEHARANARICNEVQPYLIFVSPLHVDPGSELERIVAAGGFEECTLGEYIAEEIEFVERLEQESCYFFGAHISNPIKVQGPLPDDKRRIVSKLRKGMSRYPDYLLNSHPSKCAEGKLYL